MVDVLLGLGFLVLLLWPSIFVVIGPGNIGVLFDLLQGGTRVGAVYGEGLAVKLPWNGMHIYDRRLQARPYSIRASSAEGMVVDIDVSILFRINLPQAAVLHMQVGPDYADRVVGPVTIGVIREYVGRYSSHELYTTDYRRLQASFLDTVRAKLAAYQVVSDDIILRKLTLPRGIVEAIEEKLAYEQQGAAYRFRLQGEVAEAQRLRIKADGLRTYYTSIDSALTPPLLTWRAIEATVELTQSPNAQIVIVESGKDQLPLILGSPGR